jgi:hypothetical protein
MNRLKQESTWRGVILLLTAFGVQIAPDMQQAIITPTVTSFMAILSLTDEQVDDMFRLAATFNP